MGSVYLDGAIILKAIRKFVDSNEESEGMRDFLIALFRLADQKLEVYDYRDDFDGVERYDEEDAL